MSDEIRRDGFAYIFLDVERLPIAWLAYRGIINTDARFEDGYISPSWFMLDVIGRGLTATLKREGRLEAVRRRQYPHLPSRIDSIFAYADLESAQKGIGYGKFSKENLVEIACIECGRSTLKFDATWIDNFDASAPNLEEAAGAAQSYWSGAPYDGNPRWELLLRGRYAIYGAKVRERAYATIKEQDPKSLAILELARLGAEFGSDLGAIAPFLTETASGPEIATVIRFDEQEAIAI